MESTGMTVKDGRKGQRLTPKTLISAPRASPGIPNDAGTHFLQTVSQYSFETHTTSRETRVVKIDSGEWEIVTRNGSGRGHTWLGNDRSILWLEDAEDESTDIWIRSLNTDNKYCAGNISGYVEGMKIKNLNDSKTIAVAFAAKSTSDGTLYNVKSTKSHSSGRLYNSLPVRNWDDYVTAERNTIWYTTLCKERNGEYTSENRYILSPQPPINALLGSGLVSPILREPWTDPLADFDITSQGGLVFVARNPNLPTYQVIASDLYYVAIPDFTQAPPHQPQLIQIPGFVGNSDYPVFSPCGKFVAVLKVEHQKSYYGTYCLFVARLSTNNNNILDENIQLVRLATEWKLSPEVVKWGGNSSDIYMVAEDRGRRSLFKLNDIWNPDTSRLPDLVFENGAVLDFYHVELDELEKYLLIFYSSFVTSTSYNVYKVTKSSSPLEISESHILSFAYPNPQLTTSQFSEFWYAGSGNQNVQAWLALPPNFDKTKTYPVVFIIHGGPASAMLDSWSTRWNPAIFAEHGYIAVLPNFAGSTGFGQEFIDATSDYDAAPGYGSRPYKDIVACFEHVKKSMPYADTNRALGLGGSFGGYLINLIEGLPLGKEFKALVNHDGFFGDNRYCADVFDYSYELGGDIWHKNNRRNYDWSSAARLVREDNWSTPMLIIHSELDYRCPITEGLEPFAILQRKGVESQFLTFPDENHWVLKPENSFVWWNTVLNWCNKFAGVDTE